MTSPMTPVESPAEEEVKPAGPPILIHITGPDHYEHLTMLPPGDALVVGSNPACGVHIQGDGIAGMHCTLSVENGQLVIDDWDTGAGTYVDGQRVARQKSVDPPAEVMIGPYKILTRIDGDHQATPEPADETADVNEPDVAEAPVVEEEPPVVDEQQPLSALVREELVNEDADDAAWDSPVTEFEHSSSPVAAAYDHSGFDDDTSDLLQVEIDFLRSELAERDAQIAQLSEAASLAADQDDDEDLPSREEVEALASRLEDLLAELEQSDERLKTMAELLRLSDEANVAAEEEREQMESWIGEVERRVRQWEDEWHAERDTLNKRLEEVTAQRDTAESQGSDPEQIGLINSLREQSAKLEQQLKSVQQERDNLQHRMQTAEVESIEDRVADAVEDALREERLEISQMKAEFARERAKMVQQQEEMMSREGLLSEQPNEADIRIRAFREHLKEVKATEPRSASAPSLSQRLGKLWRKIDGKPLDTD